MSLTLVTGRANVGKTGVLYGALREALAAGLPAALLLPTMPDVRRAEAELGAQGTVGARIAVLDSWVDQLWVLYGDGRRIVTPGVRTVILRDALRDSALDVLSPSADGAGLIRLLAELAQRLVRIPEEQGSGAEAEVARVLRAYECKARASGLIERSVAARVLAEDPPSLAGPVLVNRFTDLSEAQELLLTSLATRNEVVLALTWEPDLPATAALDGLVERMFASAEVVPLSEAYEDSELGRLEERLYCPGDPVDPAGMVAFGLAAGDEAECVLAARAARSLVDEGVEPERIAVVFRDAARRLRHLTAALEAEGLLADLDVTLPVRATPFGSAFSALLDACLAPRRERLLALLLSPYSDADPAGVASLDAAWRRYRAEGDRLLRDARKLGPLTARALDAGKRAARGCDRAMAAEWRAAADALFAAAAAAHSPGARELELDASAHRAVLRLIDDVVSLPDAHLAAGEVLQLLSRTEAPLGGAERPGAVQVTEVHRLRSRRFDAVVLGGLTAEEFSAERPEPLAAELAERLGAAPRMPEREAERMLFYLVATRPRRKLVLLRQESDERGDAKRPSVFWDEVVDLYVGPEEASDEPPAAPPGVEPSRLGLADLASAAPAYAPGRRSLRREVASQPVARRHAGVRDARVLDALANTQEFAVTELETYLSCPYRWFYERAVRPRRLDTEVDAAERGSRAHGILAAFYRALPARLGAPRMEPALMDDALELLDEVVAGVEEASAAHAVGLREELALAESREWARAIVSDDAQLLPGFAPVEHEFAFGGQAGKPFEFGGVALRGSIDRVDVSDAGLVITDYKSAKDPKGRASFGTYGLIQLPVYAAAAGGLLARPVLGGIYRSLRSLAARGFRTAAVDVCGHGVDKDVCGPEELALVLADAEEAVAAAAKGIREGAILVSPRHKTACEWCGARAFCQEAR